jgi:hypothetical protein
LAPVVGEESIIKLDLPELAVMTKSRETDDTVRLLRSAEREVPKAAFPEAFNTALDVLESGLARDRSVVPEKPPYFRVVPKKMELFFVLSTERPKNQPRSSDLHVRDFT